MLYEQKLFFKLRHVLDEIPEDIQDLLNSLADSAISFFDDADDISFSFFDSVNASSVTAVQAAMFGFKNPNRLAIAGGIDLTDEMKGAISDNVDLIKSIPKNYHDQIKQVVQDAFEKDSGYKTIFDKLKEYDGVTDRRADFIARDQTSKFFTSLTSQRATAAGVKKFKWLHSGGSVMPREYHMDVLNGKIFKYDDPPIIDLRTGERGLPGQTYNCKCQQIIIDPDIDGG